MAVPSPQTQRSSAAGVRSRGAAASRCDALQAELAPTFRVLARVGCFAIGTVYVLIGVWAMLALLRIADLPPTSSASSTDCERCHSVRSSSL